MYIYIYTHKWSFSVWRATSAKTRGGPRGQSLRTEILRIILRTKHIITITTILWFVTRITIIIIIIISRLIMFVTIITYIRTKILRTIYTISLHWPAIDSETHRFPAGVKETSESRQARFVDSTFPGNSLVDARIPPQNLGSEAGRNHEPPNHPAAEAEHT